ncbi:hypothetical protein OsJ_29937 [Oryza sativa Japonica Group]|uniref:Uncharacterized protein n=1 Tax=Oryza sativa subsp. japonica TaxID=39947 RepID=B9G4G3_ORYSJ|nr:hypothetical protein OsJ_29937 [Oryza sativa Japonica Group]
MGGGGGGGGAAWLAWLLVVVAAIAAVGHGRRRAARCRRVAIHRARVALDASAAVRASPSLLGAQVRT